MNCLNVYMFCNFQKRKHDGDDDMNDVHKHKKSKVTKK